MVDKIGRVVSQLKVIALSKAPLEPVVDGSDLTKKHVENVEKPGLFMPEGKTPHERVAAVLKRAKLKRLALVAENNPDKTSPPSGDAFKDHHDDEDVPDFAPRLFL